MFAKGNWSVIRRIQMDRSEEGIKTKIEIDAGVQNGEELKLRGKGINEERSGKTGDMIIKIKVLIPKKLDRTQKSLFKDLADTDLETNEEFKKFNKYL